MSEVKVQADAHRYYPICVKIQIYKSSWVDQVIYYRNKLPLFIVEQWRWYFEYLAAKVKVKHPRNKVELVICSQDLLQGEEYKQKKIRDLLIAKKAKLTKLRKKPILDLFGEQERAEKIAEVEKEMAKLERGEYDGWIPPTYINVIKEYI